MKFLICVVVCELLSFNVNCNYIGLKGKALSTDAAIYSLNSDVSNNQLSCARKCKHDSNCDGLVYNNTDGLCGLVVGNGVANTSQRLTGISYQVVSRTEKKFGQWQNVLSVNNSGGILFGSFENLKDALLSGKKLQIFYERHDNKTLSYVINSGLVNENIVCGQSETYLASTIQLKLRYYLVCTNGRIQYLETNMNQTGSVKIGKIANFNKINWFVFEDACQQVTIRDNSKPYITVNKITGFSGTVVENLDAFTKVNYKTYTHIYHTDENVEMTTLGEIYSIFNGDDFEFDSNASWISTRYNISNNVEELRCTISDNKPCTYYNNTVVNRTIHLDGNWKKVFVHSPGNDGFGSLQNLRGQVLNGHRLLIYFSGKIKEPDIVVVDEDNIVAVFSSYPLKQSDSNQSKSIWEMVSTSGKYEVLEFDFENGNVLSATTETTRGCSWFVDKATWTIVHDSESNITEKLFTALESGSDLRIKSNCLHVDENSTLYSCLYDASNIHYSTATSTGTARGIFCPGITITDSGLQLSLDEKPVWMTLVTTTTNMVKRKLWLHRASHFKDDAMMIYRDNTWFVN